MVRCLPIAACHRKLLWKHEWPIPALRSRQSPRMDLLITSGDAMGEVGMRRIAVYARRTGLMAGKGNASVTSRFRSRALPRLYSTERTFPPQSKKGDGAVEPKPAANPTVNSMPRLGGLHHRYT